jgi:CubicO group peptidase (beta-lactamase class C family)
MRVRDYGMAIHLWIAPHLLRKSLICGCLLLSALFNAESYGQSVTQTTARMDKEFAAELQLGLIMGNLLVAEQGKIVYSRSFGYQDIEAKIPNTDTSAFALASISKQITATAILQLKEMGKLQLDDPLAKYFVDFPFPDVTVRHLLTNTSGLPEYELFDALIQKQPDRVFTNQDIIPALKLWSKGLYFKPGDSWRYSSMNYCLLALLVEKVTGQDFRSYLKQHIFAPAGMKHTYVENYLLKTTNLHRTVNYEYPTYYDTEMIRVESIPTDKEMIYNLGGFYGQGGLTTTANDLLRFDNAFFSNRLIRAADVDLALTPAKLNSGKPAEAEGHGFGSLGVSDYGMGWFIVRDTANGKIVWHDGSRPGISTVHLHNVKTGQTVILLQNTPEAGNDSAICAYQLWNNEACKSPQVSLIQIYAQTLIKDGPQAADARLEALRQDPAYKMPNDYMWVYLGYQLMEKKEYLPFAIDMYEKVSALFPDSWYVTQGYAAVLGKSGKRKEALQMYKKSLLENPQNDFAKEQIRILESDQQK